MSGLIDKGSLGLSFGTGLVWLLGGLGSPGFDDPVPPSESVMLSESGATMITEASATMITE